MNIRAVLVIVLAAELVIASLIAMIGQQDVPFPVSGALCGVSFIGWAVISRRHK